MRICYAYFVYDIITKNPKLLQEEDVTSNVVIDLDTDYIYTPNR